MAYEYLDNLGLADEDKQKLRTLAAATPAALLSRIRYGPESRQRFANLLGGDELVSRIETVLEKLAGNTLHSPLPPFHPGRGAIDPTEAPVSEKDVNERKDDLAKEIERLRDLGDEAQAEKKANELRSLLKFG